MANDLSMFRVGGSEAREKSEERWDEVKRVGVVDSVYCVCVRW